MQVEEGLRVGDGFVEDFCRAVGGWAGGGAAVVDVRVEDPDVQAGPRGGVGVEDEFSGGEGGDREEELRVDEDCGVVAFDGGVGTVGLNGQARFEDFDRVEGCVSLAEDAGAALAF